MSEYYGANATTLETFNNQSHIKNYIDMLLKAEIEFTFEMGNYLGEKSKVIVHKQPKNNHIVTMYFSSFDDSLIDFTIEPLS